jgi:hypothetical protein
MKTKMLYLIIFLLVVIMILTLIYTKGKISELNQPVAESIRVEVAEKERINESTGPVLFHKEAVTVVKPATGRRTGASESGKVREGIEDYQEPIIVSQDSSAVGGGDNIQGAGEAAGVTRGKYPTKEEVKEMNSRGVVMY